MKILVHRGGYTKIKIGEEIVPGENTHERAKISLENSKIDGIEIDIQYTSELIPVVIHHKVHDLSIKQFKEKYIYNKSLAEWIGWFKENKKFETATIYLDLKVNPSIRNNEILKRLLKELSVLRNPIIIGSLDDKVLNILSNIKSKFDIDLKLFFMIPEPLISEYEISKVRRLFTRDGHIAIDGVHFFFIDSILKEIFSYIFKRGDFVTVTDFLKGESKENDGKNVSGKRIPIPNPYLIQDLYYLKTKRFVQSAHKEGLLVMSASTGSVNSLRKMRDMGCDYLMVNVAEDAKFL